MTDKAGEEMTPEETAALEEMANDTAPAEEQPQEPEAKAEPESEVVEEKPEGEAEETAEGKPEFKSSRAEEKPPEGYVPHQAMHAERVKRQELEKQLAEVLEWKKAQEQPKEEPPEYVDPLEDPAGFKKYNDYTQQKLQERIDAMTSSTQEQQKIQQRMHRATELEAQFAAETPDYPQAAQFLHNQRISDLRSQGWGDAEISQQIAKDANGIFDAAEAAGMNPAELVYYRAQKAGYAKAQQQAQPQAQQPSDGDKITALADAQRQTQGLGAAGGGEQSGKLTVAQLAEMSESDLAKLSEDDLRAVMGG